MGALRLPCCIAGNSALTENNSGAILILWSTVPLRWTVLSEFSELLTELLQHTQTHPQTGGEHLCNDPVPSQSRQWIKCHNHEAIVSLQLHGVNCEGVLLFS